MRDEIYYYLHDYGFTRDELLSIEQQNDYICYSILKSVKASIAFIESKGFSKEEVISIVNSNPLLVTITYKRMEVFDDIYVNKIGFTNDEIKELLIKYPYIYDLGATDVKRIINDYLKNHTIEELKKEIMVNPMMLEKELN